MEKKRNEIKGQANGATSNNQTVGVERMRCLSKMEIIKPRSQRSSSLDGSSTAASPSKIDHLDELAFVLGRGFFIPWNWRLFSVPLSLSFLHLFFPPFHSFSFLFYFQFVYVCVCVKSNQSPWLPTNKSPGIR